MKADSMTRAVTNPRGARARFDHRTDISIVVVGAQDL
jgi:hypothetical protein